MLVGLWFGRDSLGERPTEAIPEAEAFEERVGSLLCGDITGGRFHKAGERFGETVRSGVEMALELCDPGTAAGDAEPVTHTANDRPAIMC